MKPMTKNIFLLSMMAPLDGELRQALAQEILKRGTKVVYISSNPQSGDRPFYQSTIADYVAISPDMRTVQPSGEWKIDIWFGKRGEVGDYDATELDTITDEQRLSILRLKETWKDGKGYRDGVLSTDFYKAVMRYGVKDEKRFAEYMRTKTIV